MSKSKPFHIMVTDANHHVRDFLKRELEEEGYTISCVGSGIDACNSICTSVSWDFVILDPEVLYPYGYSVFRKVLKQNTSIQIIIHTYDDFLFGLEAEDNIHIIEKSASSIVLIKEKIKACGTSNADKREKSG